KCWRPLNIPRLLLSNSVVGGDMNQRLAIALSACMMALCFFSMNQASAQLNTADILGTVSDSAGAVIPDVRVTAQNIATNDTKTVLTSSTGDYVFNLMIPGQYTITAEAPSFKKSTVSLTVSAGDRARADIQLQLGDLSQVVEVEAQSPALQTDSATLSTVLAAQSVQDLPLNGRNFVTLIQRSEERRVGKECRSRWAWYQWRKKN